MTSRTIAFISALLIFTALAHSANAQSREAWSSEKANAWYRSQPWPVGSNFSPSTAINQLEMWQVETFDLPTIDKELGWAQKLGFNSARVFLHDIPWRQDRDGFLNRIEALLKTAEKHKISIMFVLLDSVWDPNPKPGLQPAPKQGLHNSGWVQSPGAEILKNPKRHPEIESYVKGIIGHFRHDERILAWDLINEPDNTNNSSYGKQEPPDKGALSFALLKKTFAWAREIDPDQPITSGVWLGDWADGKLSPMNQFQLQESDIITFHNYNALPELKARVALLRRFDKPLLCTEYMARPMGSTFNPILAYLHDEKIAAYNWGFVAGKTNTIYPWDSWQKPYNAEPKIWFHDIFRTDGTPFDPKEVDDIKRVTAANPSPKK